MPIGWRLIVQRASRIEYYVARAANQEAAIAAVRRKRGMADAEITIATHAPSDDLSWMLLKDGQARRTAPIKD